MLDAIPSHEKTSIQWHIGDYGRWERSNLKGFHVSIQKGLGDHSKIFWSVRKDKAHSVAGRKDTVTESVDEVNKVIREWLKQGIQNAKAV